MRRQKKIPQNRSFPNQKNSQISEFVTSDTQQQEQSESEQPTKEQQESQKPEKLNGIQNLIFKIQFMGN